MFRCSKIFVLSIALFIAKGLTIFILRLAFAGVDSTCLSLLSVASAKESFFF